MRTRSRRTRQFVAAAGVISVAGVLLVGPLPAQASNVRPVGPKATTTSTTLTWLIPSPWTTTTRVAHRATTTTTQAPHQTPVVAAASSSVSMIDVSPGVYAFSPGSVTVNVGDTVTWTNHSGGGVPHTTTSDTGVWDSGLNPPLSPGQSFSHTFGTAGTFAYHCNVHPTMKGTVVVNAVTTTTTTRPGATTTTRPGSTSTTGGVLGTTVTTAALATTGAHEAPLIWIALAALFTGLFAVAAAGRRRVRG